MILIYEPWATGYLHLEFNSNFLRILQLVYPDEEINYCGCESQINILKRIICHTNLKFTALHIPDYSRNNKIKVLFQECKNIHFIWRCKPRQIYITNALPHSMLFLKLLPYNNKISFVLHGQLESLVKKTSYFKLEHYTKFSLMFKHDCAKYQYIVLGENIANELSKRLPAISNYVVWINHPYSFTMGLPLDHSLFNCKNQWVLGTVGTGSVLKGTHNIFIIEEMLSNNNIKNIELTHVGCYVGEIPFDSLLKIRVHEVYLTKMEFSAEILRLDYVLFFYPSNSYRLTASGAIFDAFSYLKPLVVLRNPYFEEIFKISGDIGFLCDSIGEIMSVIKDISNGSLRHRYLMQVNCLYSSRRLFSPEVIAQKLTMLENSAK